LQRLPAIIADCERQWSLTASNPIDNLSINYIAPAVQKDGLRAILKIGVPGRELTTEIEALLIFDGHGSVKLLDADRERGALLLERLSPGTPLKTVTDDAEATQIAARVMRRLWQPVPDNHPFPTVEQWAAGATAKLRPHFNGSTGPLPKPLVDKAERLFAELLPSMGERGLLHGDLHPENILMATRRPWLAIDPKGVVGEAAYETGALLRNPCPQFLKQPRPAQTISRRVDIFAAELGFERERILGWAPAQAVPAAGWCIEIQSDCRKYLITVAQLIDEVFSP